MVPSRLRASASLVIALGALLVTSGVARAQESSYAPPTPTPTTCANAGAAPAAVTDAVYTTAVRCLLSRQRAAQAMSPLRTERDLRIAATRHTSDMIALRYFEHTSPTGSTLVQRVKATGYTRARSWQIGEVLAWGTGERATPAGVVASWMASPPHRAVILTGAMRDVGIAIMRDVPVVGVPGSGVTVTADLGRRR